MSNKANYIIATILCSTFLLSVVFTPTKRISDNLSSTDLEVIIPSQFGDWRSINTSEKVLVSPEVQARLDKLYSQVLTRTYMNSSGESIMLAIAYGGDQSDSMKVHKPEVCYPAQGFKIVSSAKEEMNTSIRTLSVKKLVAKQGNRIEPITYWIRVGDSVESSGLKRKLAQLKHGLLGEIPDGLLFRVSSISRNQQHAFDTQQAFVDQLLNSISGDSRSFLVGKSVDKT